LILHSENLLNIAPTPPSLLLYSPTLYLEQLHCMNTKGYENQTRQVRSPEVRHSIGCQCQHALVFKECCKVLV
jgi:hypothetical protein